MKGFKFNVKLEALPDRMYDPLTGTITDKRFPYDLLSITECTFDVLPDDDEPFVNGAFCIVRHDDREADTKQSPLIISDRIPAKQTPIIRDGKYVITKDFFLPVVTVFNQHGNQWAVYANDRVYNNSDETTPEVIKDTIIYTKGEFRCAFVHATMMWRNYLQELKPEYDIAHQSTDILSIYEIECEFPFGLREMGVCVHPYAGLFRIDGDAKLTELVCPLNPKTKAHCRTYCAPRKCSVNPKRKNKHQ